MSRRFSKAHPCQTATKAAYPSREIAEDALTRIRTGVTRDERDKLPERAYRCECGAWHLTSEKPPLAHDLAAPHVTAMARIAAASRV